MKLRTENVNETKGRRRNKNEITIRSKKWKIALRKQ